MSGSVEQLFPFLRGKLPDDIVGFVKQQDEVVARIADQQDLFLKEAKVFRIGDETFYECRGRRVGR